MSKKLKYVITDDGFPILFGEYQSHTEFKHFNPMSAGFCHISDGEIGEPVLKVHCFGESIGLNLKANPEKDEKKIHTMLNYY